MSDYATQSDLVQPGSSIAEQLLWRLRAFVSDLLDDLDRAMDARLVRTFFDTLVALLRTRHTKYGLLVSELGATLLGAKHAPAGTKRLSNLLRCKRWDAKWLERFLLEQADLRLGQLEDSQQQALLLWDASVHEKVESRVAEGLCSVRSSKAARCTRPKPGFYTPPTTRPIFVPGFYWFALMLMGASGPPTLACMRWWTRRGPLGSTDQQVHLELLEQVSSRWGRRVLHVMDRDFCDGRWLGELLNRNLRFLVRFRTRWNLRPSTNGAEPVACWKIARGKRSQDKRRVWDAHTRSYREQGVLWFRVEHPWHPGVPMWLVVSRPGKGHKPWYLLTNDPVQNAEQAWAAVFAYSRRWQIEQCFRYNKTELAMESPRLWSWQRRMKLLMMVALCYAFLLSLLQPALKEMVRSLLRLGCHRTGKRSRETPAPLYRIRAAICCLCMSLPPPATAGNSG